MSNLYVRVLTSFYSHRKTIRLKVRLGSDAFWIPPRLWAYCAENQPDGDLSAYSSEELAELIGCSSNASSILQALKDCGFVDESGFVHDWDEHNGYHKLFSERAKKAADAKWAKHRAAKAGKSSPPPPTEMETGNRKQESGDKHCLSNAPSIKVLNHLNLKSGRSFRECLSSLAPIAARLAEDGVSVEGCIQMIDRQCARWRGTDQEEYLRPETLFRKSKFDSYYAAKDLPIKSYAATKHNPRNIGVATDPHQQSLDILAELAEREARGE